MEVTESPIDYTIYGANETFVQFKDLGIDGLKVLLQGEKEETAIHLPSEDLQGFHEWLSVRFGLPCQQVSNEFLAVLRRFSCTVGLVFSFKPSDKIKVKRGVKTLEAAREK